MKRISTRTKLACLGALGSFLLGLLAYFYIPEWDSEWTLVSFFWLLLAEGALLGTVAGFLRGFVVRFGLMKLLPIVLVVVVPILWRREGRKRFSRSSQKANELRMMAFEYWLSLPWLVRLLLVGSSCLIAITLALLAGSIVGVVTIFGIRSAVTASVISWLWSKTIAFLARLALGKWVEHNCSMVWNYLPEDQRRRIRKRYRELWWLTLRRAVRKKIVLGKQARAVLERRRQEVARQRIVENHPAVAAEHGIQ